MHHVEGWDSRKSGDILLKFRKMSVVATTSMRANRSFYNIMVFGVL